MSKVDYEKTLIINDNKRPKDNMDSNYGTNESFFKIKTLDHSLKSKNKFCLKISKNITTQNTQSSTLDQTKEHSILNRFQRQVTKQFISSIDQDITNRTQIHAQTMTSFQKCNKTKLRIKSQVMITEPPVKVVPQKKQKQLLLRLDPYDQDKIEDNVNRNESSITESNRTSSQYPTITFSEPSEIKNSLYRTRNFQATIDPNWKRELGYYFNEIKIQKCLVNDLKYQSHYLKDEMRILLDNIQYYKVTILSSTNILSALKNKERCYQIRQNKIIEETCGLLEKIPRLLLMDYYEHSDKFIGTPQISFEDYKNSNKITNEAKCFVENVQILNKLSAFLKSAFEVYGILIKESDNIILKEKDFDLLRNTIQKARFNMNKILATSKNWINDLLFDRQLIGKYREKLLDERDKKHKKKDNDFIGDIIHRQLNFKKSEVAQKKIRINNALKPKKKKNDMEMKRLEMQIGYSVKPFSIINSHLMSQVLKYCKKDIREKIISLRTIDRFKERSTIG